MDSTLYKQVLDNAKDVIIITDTQLDMPGPKIVYVNQAFVDLTEYSVSEAIGNTPRILQGEATEQFRLDRIRKALEQQEPIRIEIQNYSKSGRFYWLDLSIIPLKNSKGKVEYFAAIERDLTDHLQLQKLLQILALKDPLTKLDNRNAFFDKANAMMHRYLRYKNSFSLLLIDIDDFKEINDKYGHLFGDKSLKLVAKKLLSEFRKSDVIARFGGDEFIVILPETDLTTITPVMNKLLALDIGLSIGATMVLETDKNISDIIHRADKLLYQAKGAGKRQYRIG